MGATLRVPNSAIQSSNNRGELNSAKLSRAFPLVPVAGFVYDFITMKKLVIIPTYDDEHVHESVCPMHGQPCAGKNRTLRKSWPFPRIVTIPYIMCDII